MLSQDPDNRPTFPIVFSTLQQMQIDYHNNNSKKSVDEKKTKSSSNGGTSGGGGAIEMIQSVCQTMTQVGSSIIMLLCVRRARVFEFLCFCCY